MEELEKAKLLSVAKKLAEAHIQEVREELLEQINSIQIPEAINGLDGRGIVDARIFEGQLILQLTDGGLVTAGSVIGEQGPVGRVGARGEKGDKGDTGLRGNKGDQGVPGLEGTRGAKGDKGDTGDTGQQGERGKQGDQGVPGQRGQRGERGEQGPAAIDGTAGRDGAKGATGARGDQGLPGRDGKDGSQGLKGDKGDRGDKGDKGDPGSDANTKDLEKKLNTLTENVDKRFSRFAYSAATGVKHTGSGEVWLHRLDDVDYNSVKNPSNSQMLVWNSSTSKWRASTDVSVGILTVGGAIIASGNRPVNIGSLSKPFGSLYLSSNTIYLGNAQISSSANGSRLIIPNETYFANGIQVGTGTGGGGGGGTSNVSNRLVNGSYNVTLQANGVLTVPPNGLIIASTGPLGQQHEMRLGDGLSIGQDGGLSNYKNITWSLNGQNSDSGTQIRLPGQVDSDNGMSLLIQHLYANTSIDLESADYKWSFNANSELRLPSAVKLLSGFPGQGYLNNFASLAGNYVYLSSANGYAYIGVENQIPAIGNGPHMWAFDPDGTIRFPDNTIQSTAYTGIVTPYLQVANANAKFATKAYAASNTYVKSVLANTNSYIATKASWVSLTSTNTALRTLISDRMQVSNTKAYLANTNSFIKSQLANTNLRINLINTNLTGTNTALRLLIADRMQVANTKAYLANTNSFIKSQLANTNLRVNLINTNLTGTNTALRLLISDRMQVANAVAIGATKATWTALTGTNTALRTLISDRMQVSNTKAYLANTNAYIATKVNTTTFNSALANTNAYIATKASWTAIIATNTAIRTIVSDRIQVANANAKYATKAYAASNTYVKQLLANTNAYIAYVAANAGAGGGGGGFAADTFDYGSIVTAIDIELNRDYGTL